MQSPSAADRRRQERRRRRRGGRLGVRSSRRRSHAVVRRGRGELLPPIPPASTVLVWSTLMEDIHLSLREGVRRICADYPDEYWRERETAPELPWALYKALADARWIWIAIPAEVGGGGG